MARRPTRRTLFALALLPGVGIGCLTLGQRAPDSAIAVSGDATGDRYTLTRGAARSEAGCRYAYRIYTPPRPSVPAPSVAVDHRVPAPGSSDASPAPVNLVLAHGFLRHQDTMSGLAGALAEAGHRVVTLELCNMRPWNGHHRRNAVDMRALADALGLDDRRVYAGFSAGALAALLAAADDPDALGVLTLDLVDQGGLGLGAADRIVRAGGARVLAFAGPPSACNAQRNDRAALARLGTVATLVEGASHCEFESPTNWLCELACGDETPLPPGRGRQGDTAASPSTPSVTPSVNPPKATPQANPPATDRASDERERRRIIELALEAVATLAGTDAL